METLEQLNGLTVEEFRTWIVYRLKLSRDPVLRKYAHDFSDLGIFDQESTLDELKCVYGKLSSEGQKSFKDGLFLALQSTKVGDVSLEVMKDLVNLVGYIKASEAVKLFMPLFGEGEWGMLHRSLLWDAISVSMSVGTSEETKALEEKFRRK